MTVRLSIVTDGGVSVTTEERVMPFRVAETVVKSKAPSPHPVVPTPSRPGQLRRRPLDHERRRDGDRAHVVARGRQQRQRRRPDHEPMRRRDRDAPRLGHERGSHREARFRRSRRDLHDDRHRYRRVARLELDFESQRGGEVGQHDLPARVVRSDQFDRRDGEARPPQARGSPRAADSVR